MSISLWAVGNIGTGPKNMHNICAIALLVSLYVFLSLVVSVSICVYIFGIAKKLFMVSFSSLALDVAEKKTKENRMVKRATKKD